MRREWNVSGRLRQDLVHIQTTNKRSRPPSSSVLDALSSVSVDTCNGGIHVGWDTTCKRVRSASLSTQFRRT